MLKEKNLILNERQVLQKIKRISFEIYENNFQEKELVIAGISGTGYTLAEMIYNEMEKITPFHLHILKINLNKDNPLKSDISVDHDISNLEKKTIIIIDDVLNTGRTFLASMKPFLSVEVNKIQTAVLVNRSHKNFPIAADYTGYELSTTINEHIKVILEPDHKAVYLY